MLRGLLAKHRVESRILLGFLAVAALAIVFDKLASAVAHGDPLSFDRQILLALRQPGDPATPIGPHWLPQVMIDITALGSTALLTLITTLVAAYLIMRRKPWLAAYTVGAIALGATISTALKLVYARTRPDVVEHLVGTDSASFPSGHAMNSAVTFLTLAVLLSRAENSNAVRRYLITAAITLTLLVGFSRLYLGVHWPTDVAAGWTVGALWAAACSLGAKALQRRHSIEDAGNGAAA